MSTSKIQNQKNQSPKTPTQKPVVKAAPAAPKKPRAAVAQAANSPQRSPSVVRAASAAPATPRRSPMFNHESDSTPPRAFGSHGEVVHNGLHVGNGVHAGYMEKSQRMRAGQRTTRLTGTERLFAVEDGTFTLGTLRGTRALHPSYLGPRLTAEADLHAKYRFNAARLHFVPNVTVQSPSSLQTIYMGAVNDADRPILSGPQLLDAMTEWKVGFDGNVDIFNVTSYGCMDVVFPDNDKNEDFYIQTVGDQRFTVQAKVFLAAGANGGGLLLTLGTVFVDYDIELFDVNDTAVQPATLVGMGNACVSASNNLSTLTSWTGSTELAQFNATKSGVGNLILNPLTNGANVPIIGGQTGTGWLINMFALANTAASTFTLNGFVQNVTQNVASFSSAAPGLIAGNGSSGMWAAQSVGNALDFATVSNARSALATQAKMFASFIIEPSGTTSDPLAPTVCTVIFPTVLSGTMTVLMTISVVNISLAARAEPNAFLPTVREQMAVEWLQEHPIAETIDDPTRAVLRAFCANPPLGEEDYARQINSCFELGVDDHPITTSAMHPALPILLWFVSKFGPSIAAKMLSVAKATLERWIAGTKKK